MALRTVGSRDPERRGLPQPLAPVAWTTLQCRVLGPWGGTAQARGSEGSTPFLSQSGQRFGQVTAPWFIKVSKVGQCPTLTLPGQTQPIRIEAPAGGATHTSLSGWLSMQATRRHSACDKPLYPPANTVLYRDQPSLEKWGDQGLERGEHLSGIPPVRQGAGGNEETLGGSVEKLRRLLGWVMGCMPCGQSWTWVQAEAWTAHLHVWVQTIQDSPTATQATKMRVRGWTRRMRTPS